jgi:hypothetical protein
MEENLKNNYILFLHDFLTNLEIDENNVEKMTSERLRLLQRHIKFHVRNFTKSLFGTWASVTPLLLVFGKF